MKDFMHTVEKIKNIQNKYKDCYDLYLQLKDSGLKTLMTTCRKSTTDFGMFPPDKHLNANYFHGEYKGCLTKKEDKKDFKYYFDNQDRVIMAEKYADGMLLLIQFYFYNEDNIQIVFCRSKEKVISIIGEINYDNGRITNLFLTNDLKLFNKYGIKDLSYRELLYNYNEAEVLINNRFRCIWSLNSINNGITIAPKYFENKQKDIIPGTDNVIVTSSDIIKLTNKDL